jgi:hypothetical protein
MRKNTITLAVVVALAACSTSPVSTAEAVDVPASRVLDTSLLLPRAGTVPVVIKRDSGFVGGGCNAKVFINGTQVAELSTSEKLTVHLERGQHMLAAQHNCMRTIAEASVSIQDSSPRNFRISTGAMGEFTIQPTAF